MNIYNNLKKQDKYLILVRKLKEAFISFNDDLLEVFPNNNNLFIQRIISYQLPDTSLFKILQNNININLINTNDECYLKFDLCFLKNYENYLNENTSSEQFNNIKIILDALRTKLMGDPNNKTRNNSLVNVINNFINIGKGSTPDGKLIMFEKKINASKSQQTTQQPPQQQSTQQPPQQSTQTKSTKPK